MFGIFCRGLFPSLSIGFDEGGCDFSSIIESGKSKRFTKINKAPITRLGKTAIHTNTTKADAKIASNRSVNSFFSFLFNLDSNYTVGHRQNQDIKVQFLSQYLIKQTCTKTKNN